MGTSTLASTIRRPAAPESRRAEFARRLLRHRAAAAGLLVLFVLVLAAALAPLLSPYDPTHQRLADALLSPNAAHPLGTDHLGRDMLARILYGARYSLFMGFGAVAIGLVIGVPVGALSGFYGGWIDLISQRVVDVLLSFPGFLLALSLVAVLGVGLINVVLSVGIGAIPAFVRLVRAATLSLREQPFVEAARGIGCSDARIIGRHVLPNTAAPVIVQATLGLGSAILVAAGLGFLGLGVQEPTPEWGTMLGDGRQYLFAAAHVATFPGLAIFASVLAFNLAGDGLRDALDPRLRGGT